MLTGHGMGSGKLDSEMGHDVTGPERKGELEG